MDATHFKFKQELNSRKKIKTYSAQNRNKSTVTKGRNRLFYEVQSFNYDENKLYLKILASGNYSKSKFVKIKF